MDLMTMYEQIGQCSEQPKLGKEIYHFVTDYDKNGRLYFKDEEAFANKFDAPCYVEEVQFDGRKSLTTVGYMTHAKLLSMCHYNERLCEVVFDRLKGQQVSEWMDDIERKEDGIAKYWDFVKVGNKVFWNYPNRSFYNIEPGFYEVAEIRRELGLSFLNSPVMLRVMDIYGQNMCVEATMCELSETDIKIKTERWRK